MTHGWDIHGLGAANSEGLSAAVLDSLGTQIAVLDSTGTIRAVNRPWVHFGETNGAPEGFHGALGANYLDVCAKSIAAPGGETAAEALVGIRAVLSGQRDEFSLEYPCHGPDHERWFLLRVTPLRVQPAGAVVSHEDITARRNAEVKVRRQETLLAESQRVAHIGSWAVELPSFEMLWSDEAYRLHGLSPENFTPTYDAALGLIHPDDVAGVEGWMRQVLSQQAPDDHVFRARHVDGSYRVLKGRGVFVSDDGTGRERLIGSIQDITERTRVETSLRELTGRMAAIIDASMDAIITLDQNERIVVFSAAAERLFKVSAETAMGQTIDQFIPARVRDGHRAHMREFKQSGATVRAMGQFSRLSALRADGTEFPIEASIAHLSTGGSHLFSVTIRDLTEREQAERAREVLESQLRHSQKMEAVGQLAGGIAHDFNNLLTVITATTQLAQQSVRADDPLQSDLRDIEAAADRATALTRGLLTFSRRQIVAPSVLSLSSIARSLEPMLRRLIREDIHLLVSTPEKQRSVRADPGLIEQAIMNLVINARDAIAGRGTITVATEDVVVDATLAARLVNVPPGEYVLLSVTDTGCGMPPEVLEHVFEPFFTTKGAGQGTGLGLATVYGIVTQCGGGITVETTEGIGSRFLVYLPALDAPASTTMRSRTARSVQGTETVLLVEDSDPLLRVGARILQQAGYTVLTASNGEEALMHLGAHDGPIDLILTDVVMPGLGGHELAAQAVLHRPNLKVLFTSGYSSDSGLRLDVLSAAVQFIGKPYSIDELTRKVREVLDGR